MEALAQRLRFGVRSSKVGIRKCQYLSLCVWHQYFSKDWRVMKIILVVMNKDKELVRTKFNAVTAPGTIIHVSIADRAFKVDDTLPTVVFSQPDLGEGLGAVIFVEEVSQSNALILALDALQKYYA